MEGVWLRAKHPEVAYRDCQICLEYEFEDNGQMTLGRDRNPLPRLPMFPAPCRVKDGKGCPKGTPENPKSLSPENQLCFEHYKECQAVGQFPDDPVVRRNAAAIREVEEIIARGREFEFQSSLIQFVALRGA